MKKIPKSIFYGILFLFLVSSLSAKVFFLGKVVEANPAIEIVVIKGKPAENVRLGQVYDIVLGEEIYAKVKATYITEEGFEARVIEGSVQEIYEILNGQGEVISDFDGFTVIEVDEKQTAVLIFNSGNVRKVQVIGQNKEGFKVRDENGQVLLIAAEDLRTIYYQEEPKYRQFVKEEALIADIVPGEREREQARILEIKLRRRFQEAIRLATGFLNSGQAEKALKQAEEAISIKPEEYGGYLVKGRALLASKKEGFAIAMFDNALKRAGKSPDMPKIEFYMAMGYRQSGKLKLAKKYLEQAVDHGKDDLETTFLLTEIQLETGHFNEALSTTLWALKHKPGKQELKAKLAARASVLYLEKQYDLPKAKEFIEYALKITPTSPYFRKVQNRILLEMSKTQEKELIDVSLIGGAWRTANDQFYILFFEETITLFLYRVDPYSKKLSLIIIGGEQTTSQAEELILIENPKTQKFLQVSGKALKYSQIKKVSDNFFGGEEEVVDLDHDVAFKVKSFSPLKLTILLDGKTHQMVPMDLEE